MYGGACWHPKNLSCKRVLQQDGRFQEYFNRILSLAYLSENSSRAARFLLHAAAAAAAAWSVAVLLMLLLLLIALVVLLLGLWSGLSPLNTAALQARC